MEEPSRLKRLVHHTIGGNIHPIEEIHRSAGRSVWTARQIITQRPLMIKVMKDGANSQVGASLRLHRIWRVLKISSREQTELFTDFVVYSASTDCTVSITHRYTTTVKGFMNHRENVPMQPSQIRGIAFQVLTGIAYLHSEGLVHTNISSSTVAIVDPSTVAFSDFVRGQFIQKQALKSPVVKITDFEEAFDTRYPPRSGVRQGLCGPRFGRGLVGISGYRAPEVVFDLGWSHGADVYAFGCFLFEMFFGRGFMAAEPDDLTYLLRHQRLLGPLPHAFVKKLATSHAAIFDGQGSVQAPVNEAPCRDLAKYAPLTRLIRRPDLVDLLRHSLRVDPVARFSSRDLLKHRFFDI